MIQKDCWASQNRNWL